jgi:hypothetical protein
MTEADGPLDGDDSSWDIVDEAVRERVSSFLIVPSGMLAGSDLMGRLDPLSLLPALARTSLAAASRPDRVASAIVQATADMVRAARSAAVRALGGTSAYDPTHAKDKRFADPTWTGNASYWLLRQTYLAWGQCLLDIVRNTETSPEVKGLAMAHTHPMTWWEDWATWIGQRAGAIGEPPPMGSDKFSPLADAPGQYVLER